MSLETRRIADIKIGKRARQALGDLDDLAGSIAKVGLIQPIVIDEDDNLLCGHRRLEACKQLGWSEIDTTIAATAAGTLDALLMERDENEHRKPFTPSEAIAMKKLIEDKFKAEAKARQSAAGGNVSQKSNASGKFSRTEENGRARAKLAQAVGFGNDRTMRQAEQVVDQGVPELVDAMDSGEVSVNAASSVATLPAEAQRKAVAGGKDGIRAAAKSARKEQEKPTKKRSAKSVIADMKMPQESALVQRARIMQALDWMTGDDPDAERVLKEIINRCQSLLDRFDEQKRKQA